MITIQLVNSNVLQSIELSDFDRKQLEANDFTGKSGQHINLINAAGEIHKVLFGFEPGDSIWSIADITKKLPQGTYQFVTNLKGNDLFLLHLVWHLGLYKFDRYKTQVSQQLHLVDAEGIDSSKLQLIIRSINWVRDLVNTPAEDMGPAEMQLSIKQLAKTCGATINVTLGEDCLSEGYPLTHAVGRASDRAPRVVELQWGKVGDKKVNV